MKPAKQSASEADPAKLYEQLGEFNRHCSSALDLIDGFGRQHAIPPTERRYFVAALREIRSSISQSTMEFLDQREISVAADASRERLRLEKRMLK